MPTLKLAGNIKVMGASHLQTQNTTDKSISNRLAFLNNLRIQHIQKKSQNLTIDQVKQTFHSTDFGTGNSKKNRFEELMNKQKTNQNKAKGSEETEEAKNSELLAEEGGSGDTKTRKEDADSDEDFDPEHPESSEQEDGEVEEEIWDDEENV